VDALSVNPEKPNLKPQQSDYDSILRIKRRVALAGSMTVAKPA
jgi:hypothetical protein